MPRNPKPADCNALVDRKVRQGEAAVIEVQEFSRELVNVGTHDGKHATRTKGAEYFAQ